jgi:two-component system, NarL family, sensor histidine kinase UhpB
MSIQRRLFVATLLVLAISAFVGGVLMYLHAATKVRTEIDAAISVGTHIVENAVDDAEEVVNPRRRLRIVVANFDGDRHLVASLFSDKGILLAKSTPLEPDNPAPQWFLHLIGDKPIIVHPELPPSVANGGRIALQSSPINEIGEAWSDTKLIAAPLVVCCILMLAFAYWILFHALWSIEQVCAAFAGVSLGDYSAKLSKKAPSELEPLRKGFNEMVGRLAEMEATNRSLTKQLVNLQEEERSQIARDLHDEIGPFLFATGVDATMIRQFLTTSAFDKAHARADAIIESVRHMQKHLVTILARLRPSALTDLGLEQAVRGLADFWTVRRPDIKFVMSISVTTLAHSADDVVFRLIQESLSNAVRHAQPSTIQVTVVMTEAVAHVEVVDDGVGFAPNDRIVGFGISGMQERVASIGGTFETRNRLDCQGVIVSANIPLATNAYGHH